MSMVLLLFQVGLRESSHFYCVRRCVQKRPFLFIVFSVYILSDFHQNSSGKNHIKYYWEILLALIGVIFIKNQLSMQFPCSQDLIRQHSIIYPRWHEWWSMNIIGLIRMSSIRSIATEKLQSKSTNWLISLRASTSRQFIFWFVMHMLCKKVA